MQSSAPAPCAPAAYKSASSASLPSALLAPFRVLAALTWSAPWDKPSASAPC
jgi:hypothetical protein